MTDKLASGAKWQGGKKKKSKKTRAIKEKKHPDTDICTIDCQIK